MRARIEGRWLLTGLVVAAVVFLLFTAGKLPSPKSAQAQPQTGAENAIIAVPVQISRDTYGLAMVDTVGQTLWIYQFNSRGPEHSRLELFAARSWQYDRLLRQYNTAEPKPQQVRILLENLSQSQQKQQGTQGNILQIAEPDDKIGGTNVVEK